MSASRQTNSRAAMYLDSVEISRMWGFDTLAGATVDFRYNGSIFAINENEGRGSVGLWGIGGFNQFDWSIGQVSPSDDIVSDWRPEPTGGAEANWNGKDTPFEEFVWRRYNYKSVGSPIGWIEGYHFPATDTSGRGIDGIRENFETENHRFRGRSSIDISASAGATFAGSPQTWTAAFTVVEPETKTAIHDGDTRQCLLSGLDNGVTTFKFFLDDGSGNVAIDSFGTTQTFGSTPAFGGSPAVSTLVLSVDGNQATCYLDGVQLGSTLTIDPQSLENVSGDLELRVGASVYHEDAGGNFLRRIKDFYLGRLRNVQLWNSAWDATDASNHQASPFGVIGSEPIGNLEARFELNPTGSPAQDLTGLETKPTHVSFDDLDNGITLSFGAGSPLGNFVATDFYSFGAVDGLLKDNAVSYTFNAHFYHTESQNNFSEIEDTINSPGVSGSPASAVVPASGGQVTEPVTWRISSSTDFLDTVFLKRPGQIGATNTSNAFASCNQIGFQYIDTTGGYFEARPAQAFGEMYLGLTDSTSASNTAMDYSFYLKSDGTYDVRQLNVVPGGGPSSVTYTEGDLFRITRVSGSPDTIEYRVNNVLVYTSTVAPTGNLSPAWATTFNGADGMAAAYDCSINWNRPANILDVGDSLVSTGKYDPTFYCFDSIGGSVVIGSPEVEMQLTNNLNDRLLDIAPVPGEVVMVGDTGHLVFNAADQGLPVRCSLTLLKQD